MRHPRRFPVLLIVIAVLTIAADSFQVEAQSKSPVEAGEWMRGAPPVPELEVPSSVATWKTKRVQIRKTLNQLLGDLPPRPERAVVRTVSVEVRDGMRIERFEFENGAGAVVPGYFVLPSESKGRLPAILYCHWHGGEYAIGKEEIFRADHTPEIPAKVLTSRGYAVMAVDAYCFGERNGRGPGGESEKGGAGELTASKFQLWWGRSLWGMILRDDLMALDILSSRPEVDASRIGVTGISMGATRSWWLMALDERFKAGVAVACLTRYQNLTAKGGLKYHGIYYYVPGMLRHFDTEAVIALIAPRPLLCMNGDEDAGSPTDGIVEIEAKARPFWQLYGADAKFESRIYPKTGHVYLPDMWSRMLDWMGESLKP